MTSYTAHFTSLNAYAAVEIEADTAAEALKLARDMAENDPLALDWDRFDISTETDEIVIREGHGDSEAFWQRDRARLHDAARELFDALTELVERDRAEAAASGFTDDEMTWLEEARRVLAKARPQVE